MSGIIETPPRDPSTGNLEIRGLAADSRAVEPGYLFAALPGTRTDGRRFIGDAVTRGAVAVLGPPDLSAADLPGDVALLTDGNPRRALARMAARLHAPQPAIVAAVTGTNGKTSVVWFTRQIWTALGHSAAAMGTLGTLAPGFRRGPALTTPDPVALHRELRALATVGVDHLAIEASSHGLDQYRLDGVEISAAAFTNLSRDHLDYHGSMAAYLDAKARLFEELLVPGGTAVLNADSPDAPTLREVAESSGHRVLTYGAAGEDIRLESVAPAADGLRISLSLGERRFGIEVGLVGAFQAWNLAAALGLVLATGGDPADAVAALSGLSSVPGRVERVARLANGAAIYVDYAHTPDALATVLTALRPHARGRLVVVFGCGGDRDAGKRPEMGAIARRLSDVAIVTDDNPRGEDPAAIRRAILAACPEAREIGDRREAIAAAIDLLDRGDILLVAGKGHETGQIVGDRVLPFDDAEAVRDALAARGERDR